MPLPPFTLLPYNDALVVEATLHQTERNLMAESQCHGVGVQTYFGAAEIVGDMTSNTEVTELLPDCRLLAANIWKHISKRGLAGKCYPFPVGFFFQMKGSPLPSKIL
jgi:hypothetical protein